MLLAKIYITQKEGILDPQGLAVLKCLKQMGFATAEDVKVGKYIEVYFNEGDLEKANNIIKKYCDNLLANPIIEQFKFEIVEVNPPT